VPRYSVAYPRRKLGLESNYRILFTNQQLIALHERGLNDREIAHGPRLLFTDQQLIELHERGLNDPEKAERLGVSKDAIFYRRRKLGLKPIRKQGIKSARRE